MWDRFFPCCGAAAAGGLLYQMADAVAVSPNLAAKPADKSGFLPCESDTLAPSLAILENKSSNATWESVLLRRDVTRQVGRSIAADTPSPILAGSTSRC